MTSDISILKPLGYQRNRSCGYCKNDSGSFNYYMSCDNMRIDHYQDLVDRGWRRSGTTYYKPDLVRSCCPHYTIRLKASEFKANKEQRSAVNRFNKFVLGSEYRWKLAMLRPQTRLEKRDNRDVFNPRKVVHQSEYDKLQRPIGKKSKEPIKPAHKLEVNLEADNFTKEKHQILLKYQTQIHKDPPTRWRDAAFKRFLCSGLDRKLLKIKGKTMKLGSYHQCYRLDGKLIAVGVLDLLPHAVSSVYLFYDPDYAEWDWGKLSAVREIALAIEGGYEWYYMGYYIHSCVKMRYKATYQPTYVLDPESLEWTRLDKNLRQRLDQSKYIFHPEGQYSQSRGGDVPSAQTSSQNGEKAPAKAVPEPTKNSGLENLEVDSDSSDVDDTEIPEGSLFDYNIPGVLTKEQVSKLDLNHWKLLVRAMLVDLEDLRGWEEWKIDDPSTIRGIAAELIAATGSKLLDNSALSLF